MCSVCCSNRDSAKCEPLELGRGVASWQSLFLCTEDWFISLMSWCFLAWQHCVIDLKLGGYWFFLKLGNTLPAFSLRRRCCAAAAAKDLCSTPEMRISLFSYHGYYHIRVVNSSFVVFYFSTFSKFLQQRVTDSKALLLKMRTPKLKTNF